MITITSLTINTVLKFFANDLLGSNLSRANEMLLGSILPIFLLGIYEIYAKAFRKESLDYLNYCNIKLKNPVKEIKNPEQNSFGILVLSTTLFIVGLLIIFVSYIDAVSEVIVLVIGLLIIITSIIINPILRKKLIQEK